MLDVTALTARAGTMESSVVDFLKMAIPIPQFRTALVAVIRPSAFQDAPTLDASSRHATQSGAGFVGCEGRAKAPTIPLTTARQ